MSELLAAANSDLTSILAGLLIGFLCGSIPFGYILVRLKTGADVRESGSGNIGATNVSRALGTAGGVVTLLLDAGKGVAGVVIAALAGVVMSQTYGVDQHGWAASAALGAVLGHCYSPWLGFRGGKGVATLIGAFGWIAPHATAAGALVLIAVLAVTRTMSLASLLGTAALAASTVWLSGVAYTTPAALCAALVIFWRHRANIGRLARGEERKLGRKSS